MSTLLVISKRCHACIWSALALMIFIVILTVWNRGSYLEALSFQKSSTSGVLQPKLDHNITIAKKSKLCDTHALIYQELIRTPNYRNWPPKYLPNYKNPCWTEGSSGNKTIKCLPYMLLLGVAKSGTTNMYKQISRHPDIVKPDIKEGRYYTSPTGLTMKDYMKLSFDKASREIASAVDEKGHHPKITFDANPLVFGNAYRTWPKHLGNHSEPTCTITHNIHAVQPDAKLIVILREPVFRLFSHYRHYMAQPIPSAMDFHRKATLAVNVMKKCIAKNSLRSCAFNPTIYTHLKQSKVRIQHSMYYPYAAEFLNVFPRSQMMFIKGEEFYTDAGSTLAEVFRFLGLDPAPKEVMDSIHADMKVWNDRKNERIRTGVEYSAVMLNETRTLLNDFLSPFNRKLADLLGDDKWLFLKAFK